MGILEKERKILKRMIDFSYRIDQYYGEKRKIKDKRRIALLQTVNLTSEQVQMVDSFYIKNYGKKISHNWHKLYQSYTGKFDKKYFPEIIFSSVYKPTVNLVSSNGKWKSSFWCGYRRNTQILIN